MSSPASGCALPRSPLMVSSPLSIDTSRLAGSTPGANATISIESSVEPMLTCGKAPERPERMLEETAEEARHLLLQTVELAEKVGPEVEIAHGHFLLETSRKTNRPTRSSSSAMLRANKSKHAARRTAGATA